MASVAVLVVKLHLYDTLAGFNIAISILILVAFLRGIPGSLFAAMNTDGAGAAGR